MKNITLFSLVFATVLFTACGEETKEAASTKAEEVKEKATEVATEAKEMTKKAVEEVKETATEVKEVAKEKVAEAKAAVHEATKPAVDGKALYVKCVACHGQKAERKALGKSEIIAGQPAPDLVAKITEYKAGTRNISGLGGMMKSQVAAFSDEEIAAVAEYVSTLK